MDCKDEQPYCKAGRSERLRPWLERLRLAERNGSSMDNDIGGIISRDKLTTWYVNEESVTLKKIRFEERN